MERAQRCILAFLMILMLGSITLDSKSSIDLEGIPIWAPHLSQIGGVVLVPTGTCRHDLEPHTSLDCQLVAGMKLLPNEPCQYGLPNALAWGLPIDPNTSTELELQAIKGIGPALSSAILNYKEQHGLYTHIEQLDNVHGIGPVTLNRIRPYLIIHPASVLSTCSSMSK
jgi:competence ComEA-like helix-hairpin-helix protein